MKIEIGEMKYSQWIEFYFRSSEVSRWVQKEIITLLYKKNIIKMHVLGAYWVIETISSDIRGKHGLLKICYLKNNY